MLAQLPKASSYPHLLFFSREERRFFFMRQDICFKNSKPKYDFFAYIALIKKVHFGAHFRLRAKFLKNAADQTRRQRPAGAYRGTGLSFDVEEAADQTGTSAKKYLFQKIKTEIRFFRLHSPY